VIIQVTTHYTNFSPTRKHVHSKVTYSLRVHQCTVRQGKEAKSAIFMLPLSTQNSILCRNMSIQLTSWEYTSSQCGQWGKEAKNVIIQVTTHYTKFSPTCKHVNSKVTYFLRVHQFTVRQVGKGGKECDHSSYHSPLKIQCYVQTSPLKGNLLAESAVGKGGKECDHSSYHSLPKIHLTSKHVHSKVTYSLKAHQFTVRQVGKGGKECYHSSYHSLHKIQSYV